jgi:hypothetical protein
MPAIREREQPSKVPTTHFPAENEVAPPDPPEPQPAALDQDPGGGFNPDGTYPQT